MAPSPSDPPESREAGAREEQARGFRSENCGGINRERRRAVLLIAVGSVVHDVLYIAGVEHHVEEVGLIWRKATLSNRNPGEIQGKILHSDSRRCRTLHPAERGEPPTLCAKRVHDSDSETPRLLPRRAVAAGVRRWGAPVA